MPPHRTGQPPHRDVLALQRVLKASLETAGTRFPPEAVLSAMARERTDDGAGLSSLLADVGVRTPTDLLALMRLLAVSSSYAAVSWARGIRLSEGGAVTADDVLRTSWAHAAWDDPEAPQPSPP